MSKYHRFFFMMLMGIGILTSGCITEFTRNKAHQITQEREDILLLKEDVRKLTGRLEHIEFETQRQHTEDGHQRKQQDRINQERFEEMRQELRALDKRIHQLTSRQAKDKQEIIDKLSDKISTLMKKSAARAETTRNAQGTAYGYEHTVQAGETLSEIAKEYRVSIRAIINANRLASPDELRVGEKLFIPE